MHTQTCTGTPRKPSEWRLKIVQEKKLVNIAQKMLKFQAETSLFLMRKTKQREREREEVEKSKSTDKDVEEKS